MEANATEPEKAIFPPWLPPLLEELQKEGIYVSQETSEVKLSGLGRIEETAIRAANEALQETLLLYNCKNLSEAARILEKIQIAAAEVERSAFISHGPRSRKAYEISRKLSSLSREFFHELKERGRKKSAA